MSLTQLGLASPKTWVLNNLSSILIQKTEQFFQIYELMISESASSQARASVRIPAKSLRLSKFVQIDEWTLEWKLFKFK